MARRCSRRNRGFTLAEALTAVMILSIIVGSVSAIYTASMRTYARGITENLAQQKASWAVQRMAQDMRQGSSVVPGNAPFQSSYVAIRVPNRPFDSGEGRHLNEVSVDATGQAYLVQGGWTVYYRGDEDGNLSNTGDRLWRRMLAADGATLLRQELLADHVVDNPDDASGMPAPIFTYWPDIYRLKSVAARVTVEERQGARRARETMTGEFMLRNR
jgi:prepilin-type N-terminal cleavage/methylation domain-containing protein